MAETLSTLTDVSLVGLASRDALIYSGGTFNKWQNKPTIDITDNITDGQFLFLTGNTISGHTYVENPSLSTAIDNEISSRISGDASLTSALSATNSLTLSKDTSLSIALSSEISSRTSGDISLSSTVSTVSSKTTSLSIAVSGEISSRTSGDNTLSTAISTETSNRVVADASMTTRISNEESIRSSTDSSLSASILGLSDTTTTNISNLVLVDESLSTSINTFSGQSYTYLSTLTSTDSVLSSAISTETSTRTSVDSSIMTIVTAISGQTDWEYGNIPLENLMVNGQALGLIDGKLTGITFAEGETTWGMISGNITGQTDLSSALSTLTSSDLSLSTAISTETVDRQSDTFFLTSQIGSKVDKITPAYLNGTTTTIVTTEKFDAESRTNDGFGYAKIKLEIDTNIIPTLTLQTGDDMMMTSNNVVVGQNDTTFDHVVKYTSDQSLSYDDRTLVDKGYLSSIVSNEVIDRTSVDLSLSTAISTETSTRISVVGTFGTMKDYNFWSGSTTEYEAVNPKLSNTLYFITP